MKKGAPEKKMFNILMNYMAMGINYTTERPDKRFKMNSGNQASAQWDWEKKHEEISLNNF